MTIAFGSNSGGKYEKPVVVCGVPETERDKATGRGTRWGITVRSNFSPRTWSHSRAMAGEENLKRHNKELDDFLSAKRLTPLSPPTYAFYNPPWRLPFMRRNEVLVEIAGPAN